MPIVNGAYDAPTWNNNAPPAIDASELQDMCDTIETYNTQKADVDYVNTFVRPNLLDNWYFVGGGSQLGGGQFPINQRGATSYTGTYSIDRWMIGGSATLEIMSNCVKLTAATSQNGRSIRQSLERSDLLYGRTITFSVLFGNVTSNTAYIGIMRGSSPNGATVVVEMSDTASSGSLMTVTTTLLSSYDTAPEITFLIGFSNGVASTATAEVIAAKVEIGSTQTLAHQENGTWVLNEIPNYEDQLARCQRFFFALRENMRGYSYFGQGVAESATTIAILAYLPVPMRNTMPVITSIGSFRCVGSSNLSVSAIGLAIESAQPFGNKALLTATVSGATVGSSYSLQANNDTTAMISLSADL